MNYRLKKALFKHPYFFSFILFFSFYIGANVFFNKLYITLPYLRYSYRFVIPFITFQLISAFLIALTINLSLIKIVELKEISKASGLTAVGTFGGLIAGACPGCFIGLFPAFLGLFGITATLGNLPFYGLEIQAVSIIVLSIATYLLLRETTCKK